MKHTKRRKLTVEDFNRALRWSSVEVSGQVQGLRRQEAKLGAGSALRHEARMHTRGKRTTAGQGLGAGPLVSEFRKGERARRHG